MHPNTYRYPLSLMSGQTKDIPGLPWIDFNSIEQKCLCASKFDLAFPEEDFLIF